MHILPYFFSYPIHPFHEHNASSLRSCFILSSQGTPCQPRLLLFPSDLVPPHFFPFSLSCLDRTCISIARPVPPRIRQSPTHNSQLGTMVGSSNSCSTYLLSRPFMCFYSVSHLFRIHHRVCPLQVQYRSGRLVTWPTPSSTVHNIAV